MSLIPPCFDLGAGVAFAPARGWVRVCVRCVVLQVSSCHGMGRHGHLYLTGHSVQGSSRTPRYGTCARLPCPVASGPSSLALWTPDPMSGIW